MHNIAHLFHCAASVICYSCTSMHTSLIERCLLFLHINAHQCTLLLLWGICYSCTSMHTSLIVQQHLLFMHTSSFIVRRLLFMHINAHLLFHCAASVIHAHQCTSPLSFSDICYSCTSNHQCTSPLSLSDNCYSCTSMHISSLIERHLLFMHAVDCVTR